MILLAKLDPLNQKVVLTLLFQLIFEVLTLKFVGQLPALGYGSAAVVVTHLNQELLHYVRLFRKNVLLLLELVVQFDAKFAAELAEEIKFFFHFFDHKRVLHNLAGIILLHHFLSIPPLLLLLIKLFHFLRNKFVSLANGHINKRALPGQILLSL